MQVECSATDAFFGKGGSFVSDLHTKINIKRNNLYGFLLSVVGIKMFCRVFNQYFLC